MKKNLSIALFLIFSVLIIRSAAASSITLIYSGSGLMDENMAYLQNGDIIQLIYSPSGTISTPNASDGMPTGDNILWESIVAGSGTGSFSDSYSYDSSLADGTGAVFIRFFNSNTMGTVTYYGLTGMHVLTDTGLGIDLWDVTPTGAYWWTEYPFVVIPEPPTWLVLLPAGLLGITIFRRKRERKKET